MRTQLHHLVSEAAAVRGDAPALTVKDTTRSYAEHVGRGRGGRRRAAPARPRRRGPGGGLPRQAHRDGDGDLRRVGGRRRLRAGQPAAAAQAGRVHPGRLRRAGPGDHARAAGDAAGRPGRVQGARARRRDRPAAPTAPSAHYQVSTWADLVASPAVGAPAPARPGRRPRHGRDPVHVGQHGPAQGRRALAPQPDRRRRERQQLPRQHRRRRHRRRAAAELRRRLQPAHHGVQRRRARDPGELPDAGRRAQAVREARRHRAHLRPAVVDPARRPGLAGRGGREAAVLRQHRRPDAEVHTGPAARALPAGEPVPDVRPHRGVPLDLPRPGGGRPAPRLHRQGHSQRRDPGGARRTARVCDPGEPGELVHRGALVSLGYWNDPERTAERFRPAPGRPAGITHHRDGGVLRRRRQARRGRLPLLRQPQGRDDQDVRVPGEPDRDRGGGVRDRPGARRGGPRRRRRAAGPAHRGGRQPAGRAARWIPPRCWPTCAGACRSTWCRRTSSSGRRFPARPTASSTATCCARS